MKTVYLAGPVVGLTYAEANDWRDYVKEDLDRYGIRGISPLRFETFIKGDETYQTFYDDPRFGTPRAIGSKNAHDVRACDMILAYLPTPKNGGRHSWGSICEISGGFFLNKSTIIVSDDPDVIAHPVLDYMSGWVVPTLEEGIDICVGVLTDYVRNV